MIAIRNLRKHLFYALINVMGLAIGIACFLFIFLYVQEEIAFDQHFERAEDIYRLDFEGKLGEQDLSVAQVQAPAGEMMKNTFPIVETYTRFRGQGPITVQVGDVFYRENNNIYTDSSFLEVFDFKLLEGDPGQVLRAPNDLLITQSVKEKYFGSEPAYQQTVVIDSQTYRISGVIEDIPVHTHFGYDVYQAMAGLAESREENWGSFNFNTYLLVQSGASVEPLVAAFPALVERYFGPIIKNFMQISLEDFFASGNRAAFALTPLKKIHLYSHKNSETGNNGDIKYIYIFSAVAFFVLLLACINFMNLTTARSTGRAKEVGVRKAVGAERSHLIKQFLSESLIITGLSFVLSLVILQLALPYLNTLAGKELSLGALTSPGIIMWILGALVATGLISGSYPALYLSGLEPVAVLKGKLSSGNRKSLLRSSLVVFQFFITTLFIIGTLVVFQQMRHIQQIKLGFDREQMLVLHNTSSLGNQIPAFKQRLLRLPEVQSATASSYLPVGFYDNTNTFFPGRTPGGGRSYLVHNWSIDYDYFETMKIELLPGGRNFSREHPSDSIESVIVNESLIREMGLSLDSANQEISMFTSQEGDIGTFKIIGVVKDFHYKSIRQKIEPQAFFVGRLGGYYGGSSAYISMRFKSDDPGQLIGKVRNEWQAAAPGHSFDYSFMDERYNDLYLTEQRIGNIMWLFTGLTIFIACIGLLGLAAYTAQQRTKEIGVRKVLGASVRDIFLLLTRDFSLLILLAYTIAIPVAFFAMKSWLSDFAYPAPLDWKIFVLTGVLVMVISLLTISYQSLKVAFTNPVLSLKYE